MRRLRARSLKFRDEGTCRTTFRGAVSRAEGRPRQYPQRESSCCFPPVRDPDTGCGSVVGGDRFISTALPRSEGPTSILSFLSRSFRERFGAPGEFSRRPTWLAATRSATTCRNLLGHRAERMHTVNSKKAHNAQSVRLEASRGRLLRRRVGATCANERKAPRLSAILSIRPLDGRGPRSATDPPREAGRRGGQLRDLDAWQLREWRVPVGFRRGFDTGRLDQCDTFLREHLYMTAATSGSPSPRSRSSSLENIHPVATRGVREGGLPCREREGARFSEAELVARIKDVPHPRHPVEDAASRPPVDRGRPTALLAVGAFLHRHQPDSR